nr:unnamed protein product [Callosobruchus chinensis]
MLKCVVYLVPRPQVEKEEVVLVL